MLAIDRVGRIAGKAGAYREHAIRIWKQNPAPRRAVYPNDLRHDRIEDGSSVTPPIRVAFRS